MEEIKLSKLPSSVKFFVLCYLILTLFILTIAFWAVFERGEDYGVTKGLKFSNLKLGHTHLNGHALVFFSLALIFAWVGISAKAKNTIIGIFALAILGHTFGLIFQNYIIGETALKISGVLIAISMLTMSFFIFRDLYFRN